MVLCCVVCAVIPHYSSLLLLHLAMRFLRVEVSLDPLQSLGLEDQPGNSGRFDGGGQWRSRGAGWRSGNNKEEQMKNKLGKGRDRGRRLEYKVQNAKYKEK